MSKQRSFRPRSKLSFEEDEEGQEGHDVKPKPALGASKGAPTAPKAPASSIIPKKDSKPNLLSFDDDAGEDAALSGGAMAGKKKDKSGKPKLTRAQGLPELPAVASTTQMSSSGEYTADRLKDLQRNALSFSAAKFTSQPPEGAGGQAQAQQEPLLKLSGSFKPAGLPKDDRFTVNAMATVKPLKPAAPAPPVPAFHVAGPPAAAGGGQAAQAASTARPAAPVEVEMEEGEEEEDDVIIPDADTIRLAKAKRERLRQAHLAPDYIPLGGASRLLAASKGGMAAADAPGVEAASGSDEEAELEDAMRIKFSVAGEARAGDRKGYSRTTGAAADEDADAFAEEQLRKAVSRSKAAMPGTTAQAGEAAYAQGEGYPGAYAQQAGAMDYYTQSAAAAGAYGGGAAGYGAGAYGMAGAGGAAGAGVTLAGAMARGRLEAITGAGQSVIAALQEGVARLAVSHKASQANLTKTSHNLSSSLAKIETLERESKAASDKYVYVQQVRTYMADLIDCLTHKSALVEELEDSLMELREERAQAGGEVGQTLESELLRSAQCAISAALGVVGRGGAMAAAQQAAEGAAQGAEEDMEEEGGAGPVEVDEFGRNVNMGRQREAQDRRRQRREMVSRELSRLEALAAGAPLATQEEEWEVESDAQTSRYHQRHWEIMSAADTVFADADEEFATLTAVKQRLEEFKQRYPRDYANTYMHLSSPALFAPFVRLELLRWDPLYADQSPAGRGGAAPAEREGVHRGFDKQAWYEGLFDYGMGSDVSAAAADDPDSELVPQLVRKLVLPLATHMVQKCWDPLVLRQSRAATIIVGDLLVYVPAEEGGMSELLDSVVEGLRGALARVTLPPWPPVALEASDMAKAVLSRRFQSAVRLLRSIGVWEGLLSRSLLLGLALDQLVGQQLLPYLRAAASGVVAQPHLAVARMEAVASALPAAWFAGGCPPEAKAFMELMESLATQLEAQRENKARYAAPAKRLAQELHRLGSPQRAAQLASALGAQL